MWSTQLATIPIWKPSLNPICHIAFNDTVCSVAQATTQALVIFGSSLAIPLPQLSGEPLSGVSAANPLSLHQLVLFDYKPDYVCSLLKTHNLSLLSSSECLGPHDGLQESTLCPLCLSL